MDKEENIVLDDIVFRVIFSSHALQRMRERGISQSDVLEALRTPCSQAYDKSKDVYLLLGCNRIAVVYVLHGSLVEVVTVMRENEYRALVTGIGKRRYRVLD